MREQTDRGQSKDRRAESVHGALEQRNAPALNSSPFRYPNPLTGKWVKSRYVAERHEIATRFAEWEIIGPREIREVDPDARYFTP